MTTALAPTLRIAEAHDATRWREPMDGYTRFCFQEHAHELGHEEGHRPEAAHEPRAAAVGNCVLHGNASTTAPVRSVQDLVFDPSCAAPASAV